MDQFDRMLVQSIMRNTSHQTISDVLNSSQHTQMADATAVLMVFDFVDKRLDSCEFNESVCIAGAFIFEDLGASAYAGRVSYVCSFLVRNAYSATYRMWC